MKIIGIYLLKQKDKVVYVGQSIDISFRVKTHSMDNLKEFDDISIIECSKKNLNSVESFYIQYYNPRYNKQFYQIRVGEKISEHCVFTNPSDYDMSNFYGLKKETITSIRKNKVDTYLKYKSYYIDIVNANQPSN